MELKLSRLLYYGFAVLVFLVPLFWLPFSFEAWEFQKIFLIFFLGLAIVIISAIESRRENPGGFSFKILWPFDFLVLIFLALALVSAFFSVDRIASLFGFYGRFSDGLVGLLSFILVYLLARRQKNTDQLVKILLASGLIVVGLAFLSLTGILGRLTGFNATLKQLNFNPVSPSFEGLTLFLVPLVFLAFGFLKEKTKFIFLVFSLGLIFLVDYTPAWVVLGLTSLLALIFLFLKSFNDKEGNFLRKNLALALFLVLATLGISFNLNQVVPPALVGFPREVTLDQTTSWQIAQDSLKIRPFLGSGPGTFFYDFSRFRLASFNDDPLWQVRFDRPVSHVAEMAATMGILGLLSYLLLIATTIVSNFQFSPALGGIQSNPYKRLLLFAFLATVIGQFVYYQNAVLGFSFWLFLGLIAGQTGQAKSLSLPWLSRFKLPSPDSLKGRVILMGSFLIFSLVLFSIVFVGFRVYVADFFYSQAFQSPPGDEKSALLQKAVVVNPFFAEYQIILGRALLNSALTDGQKPERNLTKIFQDLSEAAAVAKKATQLSPRWVAGWETLGMIYQEIQGLATGAEKASQQSFEKAIELEPTNPLLYSRLGKAFFAQDKFDEAQTQFEKARRLKSDLLEPKLYLALIKEKKGDLPGATRGMAHLQELYPLNADTAFQLGRLYFNQNQNDPAIQQFKKVLTLNPSHLDSLYSLALAFEKKGQKTQALSYLKQALEISPANPTLKEKLKELQEQ
ncbi:MAG: tetratricopeptide repeat protein [bacterium]|nr:tetratricopeptide repeat protein [bacterium]